MANHSQIVSSSIGLPPTVRYYIERNPGKIKIPLVPVDQLLYQPQGVPSQLNDQQVAEDKWVLLNEATEAVIVLPGLPRTPSTSATPTYRAPDHDVRSNAALRVCERQSKPKLRGTPTKPNTRADPSDISSPRHLSKKEKDEQESVSSSVSINPFTNPQTRSVSKVSTNSDLSCPTTSISAVHAAAEKQRQTSTDANDCRASPLNAEIQSAERVVLPTGADNGRVLESRTDMSRSLSPGIEKHRLAAGAGSDRKLTASTPLQLHPKVFCTYWISTGECSWGFRCRYKHEMPSLDTLKKETGYRAFPRWYKERMAIQASGPTWMEMRRQKESNAGRGEDTEMPPPREFPDPGTLRSLQRENTNIIKREVYPENVCQERILTPLLIDLDPLNLSLGPTNSKDSGRDPAPMLATMSAEPKTGMTILRRQSQMSFSSDSTDSSPSIKQSTTPKLLRHSTQACPPSPPRKGLAASRYATIESRSIGANDRGTSIQRGHLRHLGSSST